MNLNMLHEEVRGYNLPVLCAILGSVCIVVVATRTWFHTRVQYWFDYSDYIIVPASFLTLLDLVGTSLAVKLWGYDHHTYDIGLEQLPLIHKLFLAGNTVWLLASFLIRLSILTFYHGLVNRSSRIFRRTVWVMHALNACTAVVGIAVFYGACRPLNALWWRHDPSWCAKYQFRCINEGAFAIAISSISASLDMVVNLMPIPILCQMQLPGRQKAVLWSLFAVGTIASIGAIGRIYYSTLAFPSPGDFVWNAYSILFCTCIELSLGLICVSALTPAFSPLLSFLTPPKPAQPQPAPSPPPPPPRFPRLLPKHLPAPKNNICRPYNRPSKPQNPPQNPPHHQQPHQQVQTPNLNPNPSDEEIAAEIRAHAARDAGWGPYSAESAPVSASQVYGEILKGQREVWGVEEEERMGGWLGLPSEGKGK